MKNVSVKLKLTVLLTALMALLAGVMVAFMVFLSTRVELQGSMRQLEQILREHLSQVTMTEGRLELKEGFRFQQSGVTILIYSGEAALLAGQPPVSFDASEPFENGLIRTVDNGGDTYLVMDFWVPVDWENGLWVRGLMEAPQGGQTVRNLLRLAFIALPLFLLLAALGTWWVVRRSLRPLDSITATAAAIDEARDLSRRIGLPSGRNEFYRLGATFDQLFERLEHSFEMEKQFASDASHELRTPLSVIQGACEYGRKYDETPEERQETLAMIQRQTEKMSGLIAQLLSMTRLEQGTEAVRLAPAELGELVQKVCQEEAWDPQWLTLEPKELAMVQADSELLGRLLRNLVENARKYGGPESRVWITVRRQGEEALLQVRDDGVGIPADQQEKIWQRFYQVDPSRSSGTGAGLGLAMVRQIAQLHGGRMTLESAPGEGSTFTLHLPLVKN